MPTITKRPSSGDQNGVWTRVGGATVWQILSDNSDTSYLQTTQRAQIPAHFAVFDIADVVAGVDIPIGAKIESVRLRQRVLQVAPSGGGGFGSGILFFGQIVEAIVQVVLGGSILSFLAHLFHFPNPAPQSGVTPVFQTVDYAYFTEKPSGGEWDLATFNALTWQIGRSDSSGLTSKVSEFFVELNYNEQPTVEITGPDPDLVDDTTNPLFTWDYDDAEGDPQDAYRVKVVTQAAAAAVGFDIETSVPYAQTDWVQGQATQWLCNRALSNDDYTVFVQVRQRWTGPGVAPGVPGEFRSEWDSYDFTVDVDGPEVPLLTATPNDANAWNQLDAVDGGGTYPSETYTFEYSDNSGVDWFPVRGGTQVLADGSHNATVFDYEPPLNLNRWYRVNAFRTLGSIKVSSDESLTAMATVHNLEFWWNDPLAPSLNIPIGLSDNKYSEERAQGVFKPLTAAGVKAYVKVVNGPLYGQAGSIELLFVDTDDAMFDRMRMLWGPGRKILWRHPTGKFFWIMLGSKLDVEWRTDTQTGVAFRIATVDYFESEPPQ